MEVVLRRIPCSSGRPLLSIIHLSSEAKDVLLRSDCVLLVKMKQSCTCNINFSSTVCSCSYTE